MSINSIIKSVSQLPYIMWNFLNDNLAKISSHTLGWLTIILLHLASIPTLLAVLLSKSDQLPPVDLMLFVWSGLITLFFKSLIERNFLYIATICLGFVAQTVIMSLILFK
ncbi:hypothetical protein UFOVP1636_325 [uncultured Caudovirales phage]|uniref:Uncharacterized protein n=1 Tax=uncultured Caudovirales phage TaxID=2100421 RepID=A0A6J5T1A7_9CAUD|nr:hypothetical protein UFOVP1636_325 [uncultured Caudovirales phage]